MKVKDWFRKALAGGRAGCRARTWSRRGPGPSLNGTKLPGDSGSPGFARLRTCRAFGGSGHGSRCGHSRQVTVNVAATGGAGWTNNDNWLSDAPIGQ